MKGFEFLEQHPYYKGKRESRTSMIYGFHHEDEIAHIWIPKTVRKLDWRFWEFKDVFAAHYAQIDADYKKLPKWFQELISDSEEALLKRDKIRKIFADKE